MFDCRPPDKYRTNQVTMRAWTGLWMACGAAASLWLSPVALGRPPAKRFRLPALPVEVSPCLAGAVEESEVRRLLAIELGSLPAPVAASVAALRAALDCSDGNPLVADLSIEVPQSGQSALRSVDLSGQVPSGRARLLALALAELAQAVIHEQSLTAAAADRPPSAAAPSPPPPSQPDIPSTASIDPPPTAPLDPPMARPAATKSSVDLAAPALPASQPQPGGLYVQAGLALLLPFALQPAPLHVGGGLRLGGDHPHHLGWDIDIQGMAARRRTALGELSSDLVSGRATLQAHLALWALRLRLGLGLRVGAARIAGAPSDASQVAAQERWAPVGGPLAAAAVTLAPASLRRLRIDLGVEGGYLLWSATARVDGMPALALAGPWLGLSLSLGASLGRARGAK